ncbi:MAG TPA: ABC transporter permease [Thermoplasmata archaeon]|nr:ABC transporter permease [Thermoplasmata archaeon]
MTNAENRPTFLRTFWTNAVFAPKTSLGFMHVDLVLGTVFVIPFTQMLFFAFVAQLANDPGISVQFVVIGNAVSTVTYSSIFSVCQTTDHEKNNGTIEHLLVTPTNRFALYIGRGIVPILLSLATATVGLFYAVVLFGVPFAWSEALPLAVSVGLAAVALVGFGLLLGGVALYLRTSIILGNIFLFIGLLLSGVNFPTSQLPIALQYVANGFPLTWAVAAVRSTLAGAPLGTIALQWAYLAISGAVSIVLSIALWQIFERRALRTGTIVRF